MATTYLHILSVQAPFDIGKDANGRPQFSVNFEMKAQAPSDVPEDEIAKALEDAALGTRGTDIFVGSDARIPTGDGPYTVIIDTGGSAPEAYHNADAAALENLSMQIVVRAKNYTAARTRIRAIWRELEGKRDVTLAA